MKKPLTIICLSVTILLLMFCPKANATISFVQDKSAIGTNTTTVSATFDTNNTAGCLLIVTATNYTLTAFSVAVLNTPTDTAGDTFLPLPYYRALNPIFTYAGSWYTTNCVGGANTVTITGTTGMLNMVATQYAPSTPGTATLDQSGAWVCGFTNQSGVSDSISTPTMYTSIASELVYAWGLNVRQIVTLTVNNGFTKREQSGTIDLEGTLVTADRNVSSRGSYSTTFSGIGYIGVSGSATFSEGGSVIVPPIQQMKCGDSIQAWHEMGTFTSEDVLLQEQRAGDYIFVIYHKNLLGAVSSITNTNGYTWVPIFSSNQVIVQYAVVPMNAAAGDVITFGNISNNNASRVVVLHGLSALPALVTSTSTSAAMALTLAGYTTPNYCTSDANNCATTALWSGVMLDTRSLLSDFIIFASSEGNWAYSPPAIPGTTPSPGTAGTDLFPTDRHYVGVWLPGAPLGHILHAAQEY